MLNTHNVIKTLTKKLLIETVDTTHFFQDTNRLEYLLSKKTSLRHRLPMGDQGFVDFVNHLLEVNPSKRPSASEALKHPWLSFPYEPISSWTYLRNCLHVLVVHYTVVEKPTCWPDRIGCRVDILLGVLLTSGLHNPYTCAWLYILDPYHLCLNGSIFVESILRMYIAL